jgi:hypothetical protein
LHPGEGKEKVGMSAVVRRAAKETFALNMRWFVTTMEPPGQFARISDLLACVRDAFSEKEALISATFSYDRARVVPLLEPIRISEQPMIFDEIIGFTGVKRDQEGKLVYELEVAIGKRRLIHTVRFRQVVTLSEDLPLSLLNTGSKISTLALRQTE